MLLDNVFGAYKLNLPSYYSYLSHLKYEEYRKQNFWKKKFVSNKPVGKRTAQVFTKSKEILNDDNIFNKEYNKDYLKKTKKEE